MNQHSTERDDEPGHDPQGTGYDSLDPANVRELATIAGEIGAEVLAGRLTYPSETGGW